MIPIPRLNVESIGWVVVLGAIMLLSFHSCQKEKALNRLKLEYAAYRTDAEISARMAADAAMANSKRFQEVEREAQQKQAENDATVADLQRRFAGVHIKANCPAPARVSKATDPGLNSGASAGGIVSGSNGGASAEDFIALARDAESIRIRLVSCQAVVSTLK